MQKIRSLAGIFLLVLSSLGLSAQQVIPMDTATVSSAETMHYQEGKASYYANSLHGKRTASGERYQRKKLTAAHRTLPLGSRVKVTNVRNGKWVIVRINDRGPYSKKYIIDLSYRAARHLGMTQGNGHATVVIEEVPQKDPHWPQMHIPDAPGQGLKQ